MTSIIDQILEADTAYREKSFHKEHVSEWKMDIYLGPISAHDQDAFEASMLNAKGNASKLDDFRARYVAQCMKTKDGKRALNGKEVQKLSSVSAKPLLKLFDKCQELNGVSERNAAIAEATEGE